MINEQATLAAIKDAFETLRKQCKRSNTPDPLVIVYFAGHGIADDEDDDRHYLVPYDARRDKLVSTALENSEFRRFLEAVKTTRLVVFLDACHGGAFAREGSRGVSAQFVPAGLGDGSGRYIIASCGPNQESWEWKDPTRQNGIFTWHLLELLKCEHQEFTEEEIDIFTLFPKLRDRVKQSAFREHEKEQEPVGEIKAATGIVLAINRHAQQERRDREQGTAEKRQRLLEAVLSGILKVELEKPAAIRIELKTYVIKRERREGVDFDDFYKVFDEYPRRGSRTSIRSRWISAGSWSTPTSSRRRRPRGRSNQSRRPRRPRSPTSSSWARRRAWRRPRSARRRRPRPRTSPSSGAN